MHYSTCKPLEQAMVRLYNTIEQVLHVGLLLCVHYIYMYVDNAPSKHIAI